MKAASRRTRLKPKNPNEKILKPIRPNLGIAVAYRKKLDALISEMNASVVFWIESAYRNNEPRIIAQDEERPGLRGSGLSDGLHAVPLAADELPASAIKAAIRKLTARWTRKFNEAAPKLADYFATAVENRSSAALKSILKEAGISVEFKFTDTMRDVMNATVNQNVALIKSIPSEYFTQIEGAVMRSVTVGRDLGSLAKELEEHYGVTKRRAAFISRSQNGMATASMTRVRQIELNITTAQWQHSRGGKTPRKSHVANSGKTYNIKEGWHDPDVGKNIWPGELPNCKCFAKSIVRGFS